jgi:hypothetical protein
MAVSPDMAGKRLSTLSFVALVLFACEFALGMYVNLYVPFPDGSNGWKVIGLNAIASVHMLVGSLLVLASVGLFALALASRLRRWILWSGLGLLAGLVAAVGGYAFAATESDTFSLLMSLGFAVAMVAYAAPLRQSRSVG